MSRLVFCYEYKSGINRALVREARKRSRYARKLNQDANDPNIRENNANPAKKRIHKKRPGSLNIHVFGK